MLLLCSVFVLVVFLLSGTSHNITGAVRGTNAFRPKGRCRPAFLSGALEQSTPACGAPPYTAPNG